MTGMDGFYVVSSLLCFLEATLCLNVVMAKSYGMAWRERLRRVAAWGFVVFLVLAVVFAFGPVTGWPR